MGDGDTGGGWGVAGPGLALFAALVIVVIGLDLYGKAQDAQAQRIYAEQALVVAQSQARLDAAQATATTMAVMLPYFVLGLVSLGGIAALATLVLLFVVMLKRLDRAPQVVQERVLLIPQGYGQRELVQMRHQLELEGCQTETRIVESR